MVGINHNPSFRGALTAYSRFDRFSQTHHQNLSSGLRINKSGDGTGYLSMSEGMRAEIGGLTQGSRNLEQALNLVQTASGTLNQVSAMLIPMRSLAVQTATSTLSDSQRENAAAGFSALMGEIDRTAKTTHYNNQPLLSGFGGSMQLGADSQIGSADRIDYNIRDMTVSGSLLNLAAADISTMAAARAAVAQIDQALENTALERGNLGALTNRLQHALHYTSTALERVQASEATIRDADYATESSQLARYQILQETSTAVMRQSRLIPERLLSLLQ